MARLTEAGPDARSWRADAVETLEPSADRVASVWPEAGPGGVGGAELSHVSLDGQLAWKRAVLEEAFARFAHLDFPGTVLRVPGDDTGLGYRTRVSATADAEGRAAMTVFRSHELRALTAMPLATPSARDALLGQRFPAGARIQVVDPSQGEVFVAVDGVRWHGGRKDSRPNAPRRVRELVLAAGAEHAMVVDATGFWQVHAKAPSLLATRVRELAGRGHTALDLYAGAGLLTVALADGFARVISVESDADAVRAARRNCATASGITVTQGDVRTSLRSGIPHLQGRSPDAVVLDPPRSGAGADTVAALATLGAPRLVYVACDPVALARDTALLAGHGYSLTHAEAWDMFPMTHHVETLAVFERA